MGIEELEKELKELKAFAYDLNGEYVKLTQRIDEVTKEIKKLKENPKEEINQEVIQIPTPEVEEQVVSEEAAQVSETEQEISEEVSTEVVQENVVAEPTVVTPIVQNEEVQVAPVQGENTEVVPGPQVLDQSPLTPAGVEIPKEENQVFMKVDSNEPRAIMITSFQSEKLKKSKDVNKSLVIDGVAVATEEQQQVELPKTDEAAVVTPIVQQEKTQEQEMNEMMEQAQQLYAEGKTAEAEQITAKILSKNVNEAA